MLAVDDRKRLIELAVLPEKPLPRRIVNRKTVSVYDGDVSVQYRINRVFITVVCDSISCRKRSVTVDRHELHHVSEIFHRKLTSVERKTERDEANEYSQQSHLQNRQSGRQMRIIFGWRRLSLFGLPALFGREDRKYGHCLISLKISKKLC